MTLFGILKNLLGIFDLVYLTKTISTALQVHQNT